MRREFPVKVRNAAFLLCIGEDFLPHCQQCQRTIKGVPEYDHIKADGLGGKPTLENCQVLCGACHREKTHKEDRPVMNKADRIARKAAGIRRVTRKIPSRPFAWAERDPDT